MNDPWSKARWGWAALLGLVAVLSLEPRAAPPGEFGLDKIAHLAAFGLLAALPAALHRVRRLGLALGALMVPYGILLEILQENVPGRSASVADALADGIGVGLGLGFALLVRWKIRKGDPNP